MDTVLSIRNLSISIGSQKVINNISFDINEADAVLLSGVNGIGKSTLLKSIMRLETKGKNIDGEIIDRSFGNVLNLNDDELQRFRASVAYVSQKDDFVGMGDVQVRDIISENGVANGGKSLSYAEVNELIDEWIPRKSDNSRVFDAKSKPAKFSGGEQRLLSVLSVIITRSKSRLFIIDEPLNNLDFVNARNISNLINKTLKSNPKMGLLMISHCRIFPFVNREIALENGEIKMIQDSYVCNSCFGEPDEEGYYC